MGVEGFSGWPELADCEDFTSNCSAINRRLPTLPLLLSLSCPGQLLEAWLSLRRANTQTESGRDRGLEGPGDPASSASDQGPGKGLRPRSSSPGNVTRTVWPPVVNKQTIYSKCFIY